MIQIYAKGNTDYTWNGDMVLFPESCKLSAKLNDTWMMELTHPRDTEGRWKSIEEECVISAPTFIGKNQLFRIREVEKTDTEIIATALPVFLDAEDECFLLDVRPTVKNGQQALDIMMEGSKYHGESDITKTSTAYFEMRNLVDAINGTDEPTFIKRWGGEILYDNYKIIINERVGGDYGVEARYGKNMEGIEYHLDMSEVITRIIPVAYNGYKISGQHPWVDSENIDKYEKKYVRKIKFEDVKMREDAQAEDEDKGVLICDTQDDLDRALTQRCKEEFENGADLPAVSIDINMVELSRTEEYKGFEILEKVGLGDDIKCRHKELDITTKERVIEITWDCIRNIPVTIVLGDFEYDYFQELAYSLNAVNEILGPGNTVVAERVQGVLNAINTQLRYQKNVAQRQDVRAILFEDLDPESELFGALAIGTQGFQIADKRTADGRDWDWSTAFTARGGYADVLIAGILSDKTGKSFWNLDTGEMQLTGVFRQFAVNGYKSVDIQNNQIRFYAWNDNGNPVGKITSVKKTGSDRVGIGMYCDTGDRLVLGYDDGSGSDGNLKPVFEFDSSKLDETPRIINTASGTFPAGGQVIEVEHGLIKRLPGNDMKTCTGKLRLISGLSWSSGKITSITGTTLDIQRGCIAGWESSTTEF